MKAEIGQGALRGFQDGELVRFYGVPYAQPPVGDLRFRDPLPPEPWAGEFDASAFGPPCPQPKNPLPPKGPAPSEDCLRLNIVARAEPGAGRPVLVFFHGGLNLFGDGSYISGGGSLPRRHDVVLVSANFRLGPFGYTHFGEFGSSKRPFDTNLGLKDQIAVLSWVKENIAAFGGDPGNVTIWGQSAGANAVLSLMSAPNAGGLFHRAIAQSPPAGTILDPEDGELYARWFLEALGARPSEAQLALTRATADELVAAMAKLGKLVGERRPGARHLAPVVDGEALPRRVVDAFAGGHAHRVPLIIGTNKDDVIVQPKWGGLAHEARDLVAAVTAQDPARAARIQDFFPNLPARKAAIPFNGDLRYWVPALAVAEGHSAFAPTYMYRYDWSSRLSRLLGFGATHTIELLSCFDELASFRSVFLALSGAKERASLSQATEHLQRHWLAFAKDGEPGGSWPQYRPEDRQTLVLHAEERVESDPWPGRRRFWTGFDISGFNHKASLQEA
ncbi:MAG: carboxylesterase/lipase family protein [Segniliparus sp.]|uniref:carboxylesterase/lipase family protein n=1 Tax=Segniliparus sp. TaxID=2804064 RepID=UPI003F39690A